MSLSATDVQRYERDGFLIVKDFWQAGELNDLEAELQALGERVVGPRFSVTDTSRYAITPALQSLLYDRLKYLPGLSRMSGSKSIVALCQALGLAHPSLMGCCNMRMDRPGDARHLFQWHQDTVYLLGSTNAVTVWLPLQDVNLHAGTIEVIPGSHQQGLLPFRKISDKVIAPYVPMLQRDLSLDMEVKAKPVAVEARRGDLVVFKQMLLHRSTPNLSGQIRWTAQLRLTDLAEDSHRAQGFPCGDRRNIFYVDYPNHNAAERRERERELTSLAAETT